MSEQELAEEKAPVRRPSWLRVRAVHGEGYREVKSLLRELDLHTVCEEAGCPNIYECFESRTATFLILGDACSRNCGFCRVKPGEPEGRVDPEEPANVAEAVVRLGLRHAVITSVTRDDLPDGGASIFAATIAAVRASAPDCRVEVLIPDMGGDDEALGLVVAASPDILNHNIETVPRLYDTVRPDADYNRSLRVLKRAKELAGGTTAAFGPGPLLTKSGIMVGLGESYDEVIQTASDLRRNGCDIITVGQYLQPSRGHLPVASFWTPEQFGRLRADLVAMDFHHVEAAPLVRSSYHAAEASERF